MIVNQGKNGSFLVKLNFVGLGRFAIACGSELRALYEERFRTSIENDNPAKGLIYVLQSLIRKRYRKNLKILSLVYVIAKNR